MGKISAPEPITSSHILDKFNSNEATLDDWLKKRALKNQASGASRTFIVHQEQNVIGYYCLAVGSVMCNEAPGNIRRNMPASIPVMVLGRLAVDEKMQGHGIGKGLLKDAMLRTVTVSREAGIRALLVHSLSESAQHFYKRFGFIESPVDEMTLMRSLITLT